AFLFTYSFTFGADVIIKDNGGTDVGGSFSGGVWTPSAGTSTIDYGNLLTLLNTTDVTINTGGAGKISIEEMGNDPLLYGFSNTNPRTLTLNAQGDVDIIGFGIAPMSTITSSSLNVNINITGNGNLLVTDQGILTNGGDIIITGANTGTFRNREVPGVFKQTFVNTSGGDFSFQGRRVFLGTDENYNTNTIKDQQGIDILVDDFTVQASDTTVLETFMLQTSGEVKINSSYLYSFRGTYYGISTDAQDSLVLDLDKMEGTQFEIDWNHDIVFNVDTSDIFNFFIQNTAEVNQTDFTLNGEYLKWLQAEIQIDKSTDSAHISMNTSGNLILNRVRLALDTSNGQIDLIAGDTIFAGAILDENNQCGFFGSQFIILNENGKINLSGKVIESAYSEVAIRHGNGKISLNGTERVAYLYASIEIERDTLNSTNKDSIAVNTKVFEFFGAEMSIVRNNLPGDITINAIDSVLSRTGLGSIINDFILSGPGCREILGETNIGFKSQEGRSGQFPRPIQFGFGNLRINTSYMDMIETYLGSQGPGEGDVNIRADKLFLEEGSIETGAGSIAIEASDSLIFEKGEIRIYETSPNSTIDLKGGDLCFFSSSVKDTTANNNTNITVDAKSFTSKYGEMEIDSGAGGNQIDFKLTEDFKSEGFSAIIIKTEDAKVSIQATDSIIQGQAVKPQMIGGGFAPNKLGISEGSGEIDLQARDIHNSGTEVGIQLGTGSINMDASRKIVLAGGLVQVSGPVGGGQTSGDTIQINSPVLSMGYTEISVSRNLIPGLIQITAIDSFDARYIVRDVLGGLFGLGQSSFNGSHGGFIGFGAWGKSSDDARGYEYDQNGDEIRPPESWPGGLFGDISKANGNINIETGWMGAYTLYLGNTTGSGDVNLNIAGDLLTENSSIEHTGISG
ncbi:MAG: hypothetical protein AAF242_13170, partial [Bacteroidota bacterium]